MGQKTHPYGFRLGVIKTWSSKWYEDGAAYQKWLHQDIRIKRAIKQYLYNANSASVSSTFRGVVGIARTSAAAPIPARRIIPERKLSKHQGVLYGMTL